MFGWVTPNLSILFLKTSNAETMDSSIFCLIIGFTSSSDISKFTSSLRDLFANISGDAKLESPLISSNDIKKDSKYVSLESFCNSSALFNALLKIGSLEFSANPNKISLTDTCKITFIPPFKSKPLFSSFDLALL